MARELRITAIVAAYNEEDIIGQTVGDLVSQGIHVHLLDHGSTDGTLAAVDTFLDAGHLTLERFPETRAASPDADRFALASIISRKEQLARTLDADWFINHDADEFRESPWSHLNLREGIELVDRLDYNAIDFALLNFSPTHDRFNSATDDIRHAFQYYEPGASWDRVQIRCWKKTSDVELVSSAGHQAQFADRRVFPLRFLLRHYPIRSQAHGVRKVFLERQPRFAVDERTRGWHVQYDGLREDHAFIRDPATLRLYDPEVVRVRLQIEHRLVDELSAQVNELHDQAGSLGRKLEQHDEEIESLRRELDGQQQQSRGLQSQVDDLTRRLTGVYASQSWRITAPLRALQRLVTSR